MVLGHVGSTWVYHRGYDGIRVFGMGTVCELEITIFLMVNQLFLLVWAILNSYVTNYQRVRYLQR